MRRRETERDRVKRREIERDERPLDLEILLSLSSEADRLIYNSQGSGLDENEAFLTTADSAVKLCGEATRHISGWKGLKYKAAFPLVKPPGANFYPPDMDKMEFASWESSLSQDQQKDAMGYFSVIRRHCESGMDCFHSPGTDTASKTDSSISHDLYLIPYSEEYRNFLTEAAELLHKAGELSDSPSLKRLLKTKADAFLSNDYYESDIAWMELDSKLDVTIGPYETYEDALFGYKATFEAFIGIRDDKATSQVKLFGDHLKVLEENLPLDNVYKSKDVAAAPIRVIQLVYNAGDVKGPQTVAFNLPNDERIVSERGTSMVMLKNVSEAKFKLILQPIADGCITEEQKKHVDFDSFFTHTICHECCHGIGPHTITLPSGRQSTVRLELQELHSSLEEAKADIVGLWALKFLIKQQMRLINVSSVGCWRGLLATCHAAADVADLLVTCSCCCRREGEESGERAAGEADGDDDEASKAGLGQRGRTVDAGFRVGPTSPAGLPLPSTKQMAWGEINGWMMMEKKMLGAIAIVIEGWIMAFGLGDALVGFAGGVHRRRWQRNRLATEEMVSSLLAAVIDDWLRPHRIWDRLDVANKMGGSDCPTGCSPSVGLSERRTLLTAAVVVVVLSPSTAGGCRIREGSLTTSF
ncbi:Nudix hydrolase 3 [Asimina triloba]